MCVVILQCASSSSFGFYPRGETAFTGDTVVYLKCTNLLFLFFVLHVRFVERKKEKAHGQRFGYRVCCQVSIFLHYHQCFLLSWVIWGELSAPEESVHMRNCGVQIDKCTIIACFPGTRHMVTAKTTPIIIVLLVCGSRRRFPPPIQTPLELATNTNRDWVSSRPSPSVLTSWSPSSWESVLDCSWPSVERQRTARVTRR